MEAVIRAYGEVDRAIAQYDQFVFGHRFGTAFDGDRADVLADAVTTACDEALRIADRAPDIQYFQEQRANFEAIAS